MPRTCIVAGCRTNYKPNIKDKENIGCSACTVDACNCKKFECCCTNVGCLCQCAICKPKIFKLPQDPAERDSWLRSCPNVFTKTNFENSGVCELHWPDGYEADQPIKGCIVSGRPKHPPSVFNVPGSYPIFPLLHLQ